MQNPFNYGRELRRDELVDREAEVKQVSETIQNGEKLFLIGPRRYGKTSVLSAAAQLCEETGAKVLHLNAEAYPTLNDFTQRLFAAATARLASPTAKAGRQLKRIFARLKPEFSLDLIQQQVSGSLGLEAESDPEQVPLLVDVLDGVEQLAQTVKHPVGLIIDEFQQLIELGGPRAEGQIRAAIQRHRKVGYVFAGSKTRILTEMVSDHARPFYRLGARRFLGALPQQELVDWLCAQFARGSFEATPDVTEELIAEAEAVPYDVQKLAYFCWSRLVESDQRRLTPALIAAARQSIIEQDNPLYTQVWNQLTPHQKTALIAVMAESGTGLTSRPVLKKAKLTAATMQKSVAALKQKGLLRDEEGLGKLTIRFEDPFFKKWILYITTRV